MDVCRPQGGGGGGGHGQDVTTYLWLLCPEQRQA